MLANKLMKNLGKMQDMSSIISMRVQNHEEELKMKAKTEEEKKKEMKRQL